MPNYLKPAPLGSVSEGTLKAENLIHNFGSMLILAQTDPHSGLDKSSREIREQVDNAIHDANECLNDDGELNCDDEQADEAIETLIEALNLFAAPYCYFGAHPDDGADFGFWPSRESIDELPNVKDSDEARELGEDCKFVNDRGNVTIYDGNGNVVVEFV